MGEWRNGIRTTLKMLLRKRNESSNLSSPTKKSLAGFFSLFILSGLLSEAHLDGRFLGAEEFFGELGSFVGRVSFAGKDIQINRVGIVGEMSGDEGGFNELGHGKARDARVFAEINHNGLAESFHFDQIAKFMHELGHLFGAGQRLMVAAIEVDAGRHAPRIFFFIPLDDFLVLCHFAYPGIC